jgi:hypothetical protein
VLRLVDTAAGGEVINLEEHRASRGPSEDASQLWSVLRYINALQATSRDLSTELASHYGADAVCEQLEGVLTYLGRFAEALAHHETKELPPPTL